MKLRHGGTTLVTGATSGIGKAVAIELAERGYHVYGAGRRAMMDELSFGEGFVRFAALDVTDEEGVKAAIEGIVNEEGRLDVLINCAGNGIAGAVEETSEDEVLSQLNVNFFGAARVTRLALPYMREQKSGVIINVSSVGADFALPFQSYYGASKAALNALTDALRLEIAPFGIQASLVCPGDTKTEFTGARAYTRQSKKSEYKESLGKSICAMKRDELSGKEPYTVAKAIVRLLDRKRLPHRVTVGLSYKLAVFLRRFLPYTLIESALRRLYLTKASDSRIWSFERDVLGEE